MKTYLIFGEVWGNRAGGYAQIVDLSPIGSVQAQNADHAIRKAKAAGFPMPIVGERRVELAKKEDSPANSEGATGRGPVASAGGGGKPRTGLLRTADV